MLDFIALCQIMSFYPGHKRRDFFRISKDSAGSSLHGTLPYLGKYISRNRFDMIVSSLKLAPLSAKPSYTDRMWEIRPLIAAFNEKMKTIFVPSWQVCLDESMVVWFCKWAPGWMFVQREPHPFGNEYYTIGCGETRVIFFLEIVEGKSHPPEMGLPKFQPPSGSGAKTVGLMLRMTEGIWGTGRVVALDSGFCVLEGCIQLL